MIAKKKIITKQSNKIKYDGLHKKKLLITFLLSYSRTKQNQAQFNKIISKIYY